MSTSEKQEFSIGTVEKAERLFTSDCADVIGHESRRINPGGSGRFGLAFSGGGIRSAAFGLGVAQSLQNRGFLKEFHYLSTVSGGGYLGGAITWLRKQYGADAGLEQLGRKAEGVRQDCSGTVAARQRTWLNYLRQHGNYLMPNQIGVLALVGVTLRGAIVSIAVYFAFMLVLMMAVLRLRLLEPPGPHAGNIVVGIPALIETLVSAVHRGSWHCIPSFGGLPASAMIGAVRIEWSAMSIFLMVVTAFTIGSIFYSAATLVASFSWSTRGKSAFAKFAQTGFWKALLGGAICLLAQIFATYWALSQWTECTANALWGHACNWQQAITLSLMGTALATTLLLLRLLLGKSADWYYPTRVWLQQKLGLLLGLGVLAGILSTIPAAYRTLGGAGHALSMANAMTALGGVGAVIQAFKGRGILVGRQLLMQVVILLASALVIYGLSIGAYDVAGRIYYDGGMANLRRMIIVVLIIASVVGSATNLNLFNLGRMYRDRLMETFQAQEESIVNNQWKPSVVADTFEIAKAWPPRKKLSSEGLDHRLFPIINCSAVLVDARSDKYRNRGSDCFIVSPLYCGSDATGWIVTEKFADQKVTLATAVATSGAAINPHAAGGGSGITRDRLVSCLMFLFQVRLGSWVLNPSLTLPGHRQGSILARAMARMGQHPNFVSPGIRGGLCGRGMHERATFVELTDGGHFDNTAVYELIRRRCSLIVLSQASADPEFLMEDLANLIEKVRVDFGAEINFRPEHSLDGVRPARPSVSGKFSVSERGFAVADITYAAAENEKKGVLIYIQAANLEGVHQGSTVSGGDYVHEDVVSYAAVHSDFPNETTLDQFFTERQFEAYRELGYVTAEKMFSVLAGRPASITEPETPAGAPDTLARFASRA